MAHSLSAKKRIRQNAKNKARNRWRLKSMREAAREFLEKIVHGTEQEASVAFQKVSRIVDRSAAKGVIHKNQAARRKSRMSKRLKAKISGVKTGDTSKSAASKSAASKSAASKSASAKSATTKKAETSKKK